MFKNLLTGFFALVLAATNVPIIVNHAASADTVTTISSPFEFCEHFKGTATVDPFRRNGCAGYSTTPGDLLSTDAVVRILPGETVILKDFHLYSTALHGPFALQGGKLIIDGGTYETANSCLISVTYLEDGLSQNTNISIVSGNFIANGLNAYSAAPICLNYAVDNGDAYNQAVLEGLLAPNSHYTELNTETNIDISTNMSKNLDFNKMRDDTFEITLINRSSLSVVNTPVTPAPEPTPEPAPAPETETPTIFIPKAPNTGRA